jgi:pimeloyl-ACP methyl ester carboxylesterase
MVKNLDLKHVRAGVLDIGYFELGPAGGVPTILLHGFPYDAHAYEEVASNLGQEQELFPATR